MRISTAAAPLAITMWDFSWLERRWPGAGYEDWDEALSGLVERGYDAVRIDAYPHLVHAGAHRGWTLEPQWNQQSWGAQSRIGVRVVPALVEFVRAAARHGVTVVLSTWFREDVENTRMRIRTPADLAAVWTATLDLLEREDLLGSISCVDLCNEFPLPPWAPFLYGVASGSGFRLSHPTVARWMRESIDLVRAAHPSLDYTFSFAGPYDDAAEVDVTALDLLEPHLWMSTASDYYDRVGYRFEPFDPAGYDNVVARGRSTYLAEQERFDAALFAGIDDLARWSRTIGKPLVTTECWAITDYKDWPGLEWDWVKDLNERAVRRAAATGRWAAMATSNFCGPQFVGMWRDVAHHRRLTDVIHAGTLEADLAEARVRA